MKQELRLQLLLLVFKLDFLKQCGNADATAAAGGDQTKLTAHIL